MTYLYLFLHQVAAVRSLPGYQAHRASWWAFGWQIPDSLCSLPLHGSSQRGPDWLFSSNSWDLYVLHRENCAVLRYFSSPSFHGTTWHDCVYQELFKNNYLQARTDYHAHRYLLHTTHTHVKFIFFQLLFSPSQKWSITLVTNSKIVEWLLVPFFPSSIL